MNTTMPSLPERSCLSCAWWTVSFTSVCGHCKRMPPIRDESGEGLWPMTGRGDWCGEFRAKPSTEGER